MSRCLEMIRSLDRIHSFCDVNQMMKEMIGTLQWPRLVNHRHNVRHNTAAALLGEVFNNSARTMGLTDFAETTCQVNIKILSIRR
jgi:hypothetical protein